MSFVNSKLLGQLGLNRAGTGASGSDLPCGHQDMLLLYTCDRHLRIVFQLKCTLLFFAQ